MTKDIIYYPIWTEDVWRYVRQLHLVLDDENVDVFSERNHHCDGFVLSKSNRTGFFDGFWADFCLNEYKNGSFNNGLMLAERCEEDEQRHLWYEIRGLDLIENKETISDPEDVHFIMVDIMKEIWPSEMVMEEMQKRWGTI